MSHSKAIRPALLMVYTVGAAREEASRRNIDREFQSKVRPLVSQFRKDGLIGPILDALQSILGDDWEPTGKWATAIEALGEI